MLTALESLSKLKKNWENFTANEAFTTVHLSKQLYSFYRAVPPEDDGDRQENFGHGPEVGYPENPNDEPQQ